ncbi:Flexible pilin [Aeromonas hydrophila]|uniref:Flexible pilin n=1 Tax=Aeromonas hydrophila TaxID=644 RepID=UPI002B056B29|nr:Flexible pilin [Aeromonas hydrophila]EGX6953952.1 Flexible pilin [Aeromonas hydrophila]EGX6953972.1 Flexible pilin [Aeromonas hydrophila]
MQNYIRNGCIALSCSLTAMAANADGGSAAAAAAAAALDSAKTDVDMTAPKVMLVVATVVGVVILIGLMRKA